ncbi:MAG: carbamoyl-phosphate synthase large subunit [Deltaproteobacteria bacterium]|nr:carbamoyl-phosphate synthase large subunit [Deltaproteobacteria bacterium]
MNVPRIEAAPLGSTAGRAPRKRLPPGSTVLVIGSGPIVIGQASEFDYSGTQACKALKALGYRVVLINSNPATIMTDPWLADATYVEPLTLDAARQIVEREKPDALLPTVGGQVALNLALELHHAGVLAKHNVRLIGADPEAIEVAEDRQRFKDAMIEIGAEVAESGTANSLAEAEALVERVGLPAIIRPSFTLGGAGGGVAWNMDEFRQIAAEGLAASPTSQILVEESLLGWKEFELEVMRDLNDNVIIICAIENFDPMGIHTGDSITVAPPMTLTDREYQALRDLSMRIIRRIGVETGGSNVQFAVNPDDGRIRVIELNPRVSRSSALASKATGFPIAKIAAQLAVGLTLDEILNDITKVTPACFEPALDYVIVKIPRWNFEKFGNADRTLGTAMRSVGEVMGIGRTFQEACLKAISSLEGGYPDVTDHTDEVIREALSIATPDRMAAIFEAFRRGWDPSEVHRLSRIDKWFLAQLREIVSFEQSLAGRFASSVSTGELRTAKRMGIPDAFLGKILGTTEAAIADRRRKEGVIPTFKRVDTCAAEFESHTPYLYSTYEDEDEAGDEDRPRVIILGNGPNRIGQGIEFDYACCHAAYAVKEAGLCAVMVNCNPETVSTDYDTSDKLYFEPCTAEHVQSILDREKPRGVILQFGGQTPLKLAHAIRLPDGRPAVLGTPPEAIDLAEDRQRFGQFLRELGIPQPEGVIAENLVDAAAAAARLGYPLLVRPSYVLGGRAMKICYDQADFDRVVVEALASSEAVGKRSLLIDRYLENAREYDVDLLADGTEVMIAGIIEHIEEAGIHSGDSTGIIPPVNLSAHERKHIEEYSKRIALKLGVIGLANIQYAVRDGEVYVLEVNPRSSRTVPFVAKAIGLPLAKLATRLCLGEKIADLGPLPRKGSDLFFVKAPVFPWRKFPGSDVVLGPEMRSTGEVMGVGWSFGEAYAKALLAAGLKLPTEGGVFLSLRDGDKPAAIPVAGALMHMGFKLFATHGTARYLEDKGIACESIYKVREGRPDIVDHIKNGRIQLMINTPQGKKAQFDELAMRLAGLRYGIPCITTVSAARTVVSALRSLRAGELRPIKLQEIV